MQAKYATGTAVQSIYGYSYPSGTLSKGTDPLNHDTSYEYNASGQVTKVTDALGHTTQGSFDVHDNRLTSLNGLGNTTTYAYNANNSLTKVTSPAGGAAGAETTFAYPSNTGDPVSNYQPTSSVSSENQMTFYSYDAATNNRFQTTTPGRGGGAGGTPTLNYQGDAAGTSCGAKKGQVCKSTDGNGNVTSYTYGALGMPTTITHPAPLGAVTNAYYDSGRLLSSTDAKGQVTDYYYDGNDRLVEMDKGVNCASKCVSYDYDGRGNLLERTDDSGLTTYTYDAQNRPTSKTAGGVTTSVTYDAASNVTSFTDPTGTVTYKYDAANRLVSLAEPGGSCPTTPAFPNSTKCTGFGYDNADRRTTTTYPTGVKNTTVYDFAGRTTSITATNTSAAVLARRAYTFTTNGTKDGALRETVTDQAGVVTTYGYDEVNRLWSAFTSGSSNSDLWSYDKNGNRTTATKSGTSSGAVYSAYNAADQLCWTGPTPGTCATPPSGAVTYAYDANGNPTTAGATTQAYNVFDQFISNTSGGVTTNFTYAGPRNDERLTAGSTAFLNGSLGTTRQTTAGASTSFIRDPNGTLISMRTSTGASFYYTTDALGSIILLTDSNQAAAATYAYDPWGQTTTATGPQAANNPWTYAGGYKDTTTGYTKFGARYYNPTTGRFTQPDPSGQETNRYAYAQCNPTNNTDPTGLATAECVKTTISQGVVPGAIWGAGVGAVAGGFTGAVLGAGVGAPIGAISGGVIGALGGIFGAVGQGLIQGLMYCP